MKSNVNVLINNIKTVYALATFVFNKKPNLDILIMKSIFSKPIILVAIFLLSGNINAQDFQGKAYYVSKTSMDLSAFSGGRQLSEAQKKQQEARMKPFLEKTYVLSFNQEESMFKEDEKLAAVGGGGRGFGGFANSFTAGPQYKNLKTKTFLQDQEFFGKQFLIKEEMEPLEWKMGTESKQIGQYTVFKATATKESTDMDFTKIFRRGRNNSSGETKAKPEEEEVQMIEIVAWYTPQVPVSQGPAEYWGLPGLILELSAGDTTMLCTKLVINPKEKSKIAAPDKGEIVSKKEYNKIITEKMEEQRNNRGRGGDGRRRN
jgi:GLPGLI family protein